jgi:hypothetical protein
MPTKKDAIEYLKEQRSRYSGAFDITDVDIDSFEVKPTKKNIARLLNSEVGTGW